MGQPNTSIDATFPMPFSGINRRIRCNKPQEFVAALALLAKSRGVNPYAIDPPNRIIYCTAADATVLQGLLGISHNRIARYNVASERTNVDYPELRSVQVNPSEAQP